MMSLYKTSTGELLPPIQQTVGLFLHLYGENESSGEEGKDRPQETPQSLLFKIKFVGQFQCNHRYKHKTCQQRFICKWFNCVQPHVRLIPQGWLFPGMIVISNIYIFSILKLLGLKQQKNPKQNKRSTFLDFRVVYGYDPLQKALPHTHTVAVQVKIKPHPSPMTKVN